MKTQLFILSLLSGFTLTAFCQKPNPVEISVFTKAVYFDFGKHEIRQESDSVLQSVANEYRKLNNAKVKITAHTDSIGSIENNLALSKRRAEMVKEALSNKGIPPYSIAVRYWGEKNPAASNNSDTGRQLNRRTTIELYFTLKLVPVEGSIKDVDTGRGIESEVIVHTKYTRDSTRSDSSGYFRATAPEGEVAAVDVLAKGYFLKTTMLRVLPGKMSPLQIKMSPALPGSKADIENLYFVGNQAVLLGKSEPTLPRLLRFMQINWHLKIEIAGHINHPSEPPVTKNTWNYQLSVSRAKMVFDYLLENGISKDRIRYVGYGNWQMRYPKARSAEEQEANRRVEIRVLED